LVTLLLANNQLKNLKSQGEMSGPLKLPFRPPAVCVQQYRFSHTNVAHFAVITWQLTTASYFSFARTNQPLKKPTFFCPGFQEPLSELSNQTLHILSLLISLKSMSESGPTVFKTWFLLASTMRNSEHIMYFILLPHSRL